MRYFWIFFLCLPALLRAQEDGFPFLLAPDIGYSLFLPSQYQQYGPFDGPRIGTIFYSYTDDFEKIGEAAQQAYALHFSFLRSRKIPQERLFIFSFSGRFSFENHFNRQYLLPYFGLEAGGLKRSQEKMVLHISPILGLEIFHSEPFAIYFQTTYKQAMTAQSKQLSGLQLELGVYLRVIYYQPIKLEIL